MTTAFVTPMAPTVYCSARSITEEEDARRAAIVVSVCNRKVWIRQLAVKLFSGCVDVVEVCREGVLEQATCNQYNGSASGRNHASRIVSG